MMYYEDEFEQEIDYREYLGNLSAAEFPEEIQDFCRDLYKGDPWILNLPRYMQVNQAILNILSVIPSPGSKLLYSDPANPGAFHMQIDARRILIKDIKAFADILQSANSFSITTKRSDMVSIHIIFQDVYIPVE